MGVGAEPFGEVFLKMMVPLRGGCVVQFRNRWLIGGSVLY